MRSRKDRAISTSRFSLVLVNLFAFAPLCASELDLNWSTFFGGGGDEWIRDVSVDIVNGEEVITIAGVAGATSHDFLGEVRGSRDSDAFVARLSANGKQIEWVRSFGGVASDGATALAVGSTGEIAVVGWGSIDFPLTPGAIRSCEENGDAFAALLDQDGNITYATCLGGGSEDLASAVALDPDGTITVFGLTFSQDFPTTPDSFQSFFGGGENDSFITRIVPDATLDPSQQIEYSTFLGGEDSEAPANRWVARAFQRAMTSPEPGVVIVAGSTASTIHFPLKDGFDHNLGGNSDMFVAKLRLDSKLPAATQLEYSTYLGGSADFEHPTRVTTDATGNIVLAGISTSFDFPVTPRAVQSSNRGSGDGVLVVLDPTSPGELPIYATFLGGDLQENITGLALLPDERIAICGYSASSSLPPDQTGNGGFDAFLAIIDREESGGDQLCASRLVGGRGHDEGSAIAATPDGDIVLTGITLSSDFPVDEDAIDTTRELAEGFVRRYAIEAVVPPPPFLRGDCNEDGELNIADAVCSLDWLFGGGDAPACVGLLDVNADNNTDISDATSVLNYLFVGGPPPTAPFPACERNAEICSAPSASCVD